jgi:lipoyl(octanoyl) transferase
MNCAPHGFNIKLLGLRNYTETWQEMLAFTNNRTAQTQDEIWLLQHSPVFTLGLAGKKEHMLKPGSIPIVQSDRGGQVTYHGPGQIIAYVLFDLHRAKIGVRKMVEQLQESIIDLLKIYGIKSHTISKAPGVYVENRKIASLGLRVRKGCCFHGLSLNVDMDLEPFTRINPCGYPDMQVTQMKNLGIEASIEQITEQLSNAIENRLSKQQGHPA